MVAARVRHPSRPPAPALCGRGLAGTTVRPAPARRTHPHAGRLSAWRAAATPARLFQRAQSSSTTGTRGAGRELFGLPWTLACSAMAHGEL